MLEAIQEVLEPLGTATRVLLEALSVLTVLPARPSNQARLTFGSWLALALEFQLGADIVATTTSPTESNLIQLGVIAVIRTLLNIFLGREIEAEQRWEEEAERRAAAREGFRQD
jgi:uncharacterized membrane protein